MEYINNIDEFSFNQFTAVTIGKFDALHKGHRLLIDHVTKQKKIGLKAVAIIFSTFPKVALGKADLDMRFIISKSERKYLMEHLGIDYLVELKFDDKLIKTPAEDFIKFLVDKLNMKYLCVGDDFRFGYKGQGDVDFIKTLTEKYDFEFDYNKRLEYENAPISATRIREDILKGDLANANNMLGYEFFIKNKVVRGNMIGRTMGFPTANMIPSDEKILPPFGVYVTRTSIDGVEYFGVTNIGLRPTIHEETKRITVETNLLGFDGDLYEKEMTLHFLEFIRKEKKYGGVDELKNQITSDVNTSIDYIKRMTKLTD